MSGTVNFVSDPVIPDIPDRPYDRPFMGKGIEDDPLGVHPGAPASPCMNLKSVFETTTGVKRSRSEVEIAGGKVSR